MFRIHLVVIKKKVIGFVALSVLFLILILISLNYLYGFENIADLPSYYSSDDNDFSSHSANGGKLAIIIDDFGSSRKGVAEMMAINRHLTFAVLPFLDYSNIDAVTAHEKGFEVIAHLPLEPNYGRMSWLGPNPILSGMKSDEVMKIVRESIENIPYAAGANIHMGSKASNEENIVSAMLDVIKEKDLYFVDSRTANHPIGVKISHEKNVLCFDRNVFLDGQQPKSFIIKRLIEAGNIALKRGYAVAIGHVGIEGGEVTADAISEMLPEFDKKNIQLVFVSELNK